MVMNDMNLAATALLEFDILFRAKRNDFYLPIVLELGVSTVQPVIAQKKL